VPWWSVTRSFGGLFRSNTSLGSGMVVSLVSGGKGGSDEALGIMALWSSQWGWRCSTWDDDRVHSTRGWALQSPWWGWRRGMCAVAPISMAVVGGWSWIACHRRVRWSDVRLSSVGGGWPPSAPSKNFARLRPWPDMSTP
jgi:hypothetical protein